MFWILTSRMCCNTRDISSSYSSEIAGRGLSQAIISLLLCNDPCSMQHWCSDSLTKIHQQHYQIMHLLITIPNCKRQAKNKGTNWDPEQKPFLHSLQWVTEDEAKTWRVFTWAYRDGTAAPSDNPGQAKWGGTEARVEMPHGLTPPFS